MACSATGWGTGVWGMDPWAGVFGGVPGGPLPVYLPDYDIYCVGPCGDMRFFDTYLNVDEYGVAGQFFIRPVTNDFVLKSDNTTLSGGVISTALVYVDVGVPSAWTLEYTVFIDDMPVSFLNVEDEHVFVGAVNHTGSSAGLFFSQTGIAYTGTVWYDATYKLHLNSAFQVLPDSAGLVLPGDYYTIRMVVDDGNGITYVYITRSLDIPTTGHVLRYVLPAIKSSTSVHAVADGTYISTCGSALSPSQFALAGICLGTGLLIPNVPPVADAGADQAIRKCSIVRLDGRGSYDPEGATLQYLWQLLDAPDVSSFIFLSDDGLTQGPPPAVYTNRLYSTELGVYHAAADTEVLVGDVITLPTDSYTITGLGVDGFGFYVTLDSYALPVSTSNISFRFLKQNGISAPTTAQPSFYPDVTGVFRFGLVVFDGALFSSVSSTIVNVVESVVPRGCTPDVSFLWNYLSDFWTLVDNKEHISTFWGALAQVAASEMLALWQLEYNKSLRDIQRTMQRKWLHYDLKVPEPQKEDTRVSYLYAGVYLDVVPPAGLPVQGQSLYISSPLFGTSEVLFQGAGPTMSEADIYAQLASKLPAIHPDLVAVRLSNPISGSSQLCIRAPFPFRVEDTSSAVTLLSVLPAYNTELSGSAGVLVGTDVLVLDRDVSGLLQEDDLLVVGSEAYRVARVVSKPATDTWANQRLVLKDPIPLTADTSSWRVVRGVRSDYLDFYNACLVEGDLAGFEVTDKGTGGHTHIEVPVYGAAASMVDVLAVEVQSLLPFLHYSDLYDVKLEWVHRRSYLPVDDLVVSVPLLQEKIKTSVDSEILRENVDFFVDTHRGHKVLRFVTGLVSDVWQWLAPPARMWAEITYLDNRPAIESNFGIPAGFTLDDLTALNTNLDYLSAVRGMWYSYLHGPTMRNLRVGTQILLGLPFAEEDGVIEEIRTDFSPTQGRILIRDSKDTGIVRSYAYPKVLALEVSPVTGNLYAEGDSVSQFAPLVEGVEVVDYVKDPRWFEGYLNQGCFYEVEKFFNFLVRIDVAAFSLSSLLFVQSFVKKIKPTYTLPKFVVRYNVNQGTDSVDVTDVVLLSGTLRLHDDISRRGVGHWMHIDDPNQAGGGVMGVLDDGRPFTANAVYPDPVHPVVWGLDKSELVPEDSIFLESTLTMDGFTLPTLDSIWALDRLVHFNYQFSYDVASVDYYPSFADWWAPVQIGEAFIAPGNYTCNTVVVDIVAMGDRPTDIDLLLLPRINGLFAAPASFTLTAGVAGTWSLEVAFAPFGWLAGDTIEWFIEADNPVAGAEANFHKILVKVGDSYAWALDTAPPAADYTVARLL